MTDIRDRETDVEVATENSPVRARAVPMEAPRSSLVSRLAPLRRAKGRDVTTIPSTDLRLAPELVAEPRSRTRMVILFTFLAVVIAPTVAAGIYLFAFASDQYVAETRFAVRNADAPSGADGVKGDAGGIGGGAMSLLAGGPNLASEDAEIIASYIHSRAAVEEISRLVDVRAIFQRPDADFWARLPSDASAEDLTKYWNRMITVYVESSSGIVQVSASAFRRQDALDLTKAVLTASEKLANSLNLKMQADQSRIAEDEVRRSEGNVRFALADLTAFRNSQHLIDPKESAESTGKLLLQLMGDKIETEGRLYVVQRAQGANAPGITGIKARLDSINTHVAELQNQMAGDKQMSKNMAATLARFEELELKKLFAEKMFEFSRQGLERARIAAIKQSIYLAVFVPPTLPQEFSYPERYIDLFFVLLVSVMTWASGAVITASVLDHRL